LGVYALGRGVGRKSYKSREEFDENTLYNAMDGHSGTMALSPRSEPGPPSRRQGVYWIGTVPYEDWTPSLVDGVQWIIGQGELGSTTGFRHWQFVVLFKNKQSLRSVRRLFPSTGHYELTRSDSAEKYVQKEDTRIPDTQFEYGVKPFKRNAPKDWEAIWDAAKRGDLLAIPADIRVNSYRSLRSIATDFLVAAPIEKVVLCYWGASGTGKSRAAWDEAGFDSYPKDPRTKFWCGYQGQANVVIDEFRGGIDISHLLRWLDRYPVIVEVKGGATAFRVQRIWITSNLAPESWYPDLDADTMAALRRRMRVTHFQ